MSLVPMCTMTMSAGIVSVFLLVIWFEMPSIGDPAGGLVAPRKRHVLDRRGPVLQRAREGDLLARHHRPAEQLDAPRTLIVDSEGDRVADRQDPARVAVGGAGVVARARRRRPCCRRRCRRCRRRPLPPRPALPPPSAAPRVAAAGSAAPRAAPAAALPRRRCPAAAAARRRRSADPACPRRPSLPATPVLPAAPVLPATPVLPPAPPALPATPVLPALPLVPAAPLVPALPVVPAVPVVPASPAGAPPACAGLNLGILGRAAHEQGERERRAGSEGEGSVGHAQEMGTTYKYLQWLP